MTSLTLFKINASKNDDPGMPYVSILSFKLIDVQNNALTIGDASAIFPSIPFRINSQTAGILNQRIFKKGEYDVRNCGWNSRRSPLQLRTEVSVNVRILAYPITDPQYCATSSNTKP